MRPVSSACLVGLLSIAVSSGCHNPLARKELVALKVEALSAPTTIAAGTTLTVTLRVQVGGCLTFDHIESARSDSVAVLTVWGRDIRAGRNKEIMCPREFLETREYLLDPPFGGRFTVRVDRGRLSPLTATVQVQ